MSDYVLPLLATFGLLALFAWLEAVAFPEGRR